MDEQVDESSEVYNHYLELSKPTEDDFKRVFSDEELKELCLKHKATVDMWRWNVVNDYRILFTQSGRFQRWSEYNRLRMLAKAVNKMKPSVLYDEEEIRKTRKEEWGLQLKENILSLNFWQRKRLRNSRLFGTESDNIDRQIELQCEVNTDTMSTEIMNIREAFTQSERSDNAEVIQQRLGREEKSELIPSNSGKATQSLINEDNDIALADLGTEYLVEEDSEDSVETIMLNEQRNNEILNSDEIAPEVAHIYDVSTMSMTIGSEMCIQSNELQELQSQDIIPISYDNFINIIPLTSTQSQSQESANALVT